MYWVLPIPTDSIAVSVFVLHKNWDEGIAHLYLGFQLPLHQAPPLKTRQVVTLKKLEKYSTIKKLKYPFISSTISNLNISLLWTPTQLLLPRLPVEPNWQRRSRAPCVGHYHFMRTILWGTFCKNHFMRNTLLESFYLKPFIIVFDK